MRPGPVTVRRSPDGSWRAVFAWELLAAGVRGGAGPGLLRELVARQLRGLEKLAELGEYVSLEFRLEKPGGGGAFRVRVIGQTRGASRAEAESRAADFAIQAEELLSPFGIYELAPAVEVPGVVSAPFVVEFARLAHLEDGFPVVPSLGGDPLGDPGTLEFLAAVEIPMVWGMVVAPARLTAEEEGLLRWAWLEGGAESARFARELRDARGLLVARSFLAAPGPVQSAVLQALAIGVAGRAPRLVRVESESTGPVLDAWRDHSFAGPAGIGRLAMLATPQGTLPLVHLPIPDESGRVATWPLPAAPGPRSEGHGHGRLLSVGQVKGPDGTESLVLRPEEVARHTYVVGMTGTGKSTFLLRLIQRDIHEGRGLCLLDPHGDLADAVLASIPDERVQDVVAFNPLDVERPSGLNLFDAPTAEEQRLLVSESVAIFERLYGPEMFGPRVQDYFRNLALTLIDTGEGAALPDLVSLLVNTDFQASRRKAVKDPFLQAFWRQYDAQNERERTEMIPYIAAKFSPFYSEPLMRNIMGQTRNNLRLGPLMDRRAIVVANLAKGAIGEMNSRLLGMVLVAKIQTAAMMRARSRAPRVPFRLYVDEFQNFVSPTFACLLSEGRKYGLSIVLANQFLAQLARQSAPWGDAFDAVDANVANLVVFRVGQRDAERLAPRLGADVEAGDITRLSSFHAFASLEGRSPRQFRSERVPIGDPGRAEFMTRLSSLRYGAPREAVEAGIFRRLQLAPGSR